MTNYWDKGRQTVYNNFSSPPPVRYHGLHNQGATCYLNSVLQVLFMTEDFREAVESHCWKNPDTEWIDRQLTALFDDLKEQTANTCNITRKLGISRVYEQQDAAEYYEKILSLTSSDASQIFHGWVTDRTTCSGCGTETDTDGPFWHLPLALVDSCSEHYSVVDGIKEHFRASEFSGENQMYCEQCDNKYDATIQCVMKHHPEVLMLLLKRFEFDYRYMTYVKINQTVDVPHTLQIPENQRYELYAIVDHIGDLRSGHYSATIWDDEKWFNFNDSRVTLADYQPFQVDNFEKSRSAYLLFYRKQNDTQPPRPVSAPEGSLPAISDVYDHSGNVRKKRQREEDEAIDRNEEPERVRSRGVELQPDPRYYGNDQDTIPHIHQVRNEERNYQNHLQDAQAEEHRDEGEILLSDKKGKVGNAEDENQAEEMEPLLSVTQPEESVDYQDSGKESAQDVSDDLKPDISDMLAKDAHLRKEVETPRPVSAPGGSLPAIIDVYDQSENVRKTRGKGKGEAIDSEEEPEIVRSRGVELQPEPHYYGNDQDTIPDINQVCNEERNDKNHLQDPQAEEHRDEGEILTGDKKGKRGNAEAENQAGEMEPLLRVTQREQSVDDQDSGKESAPDVSNDLKPDISGVLAKDAMMTRVMDVKTGEDKQSAKEEKSLTNSPEDNAGENVDGNLRATQEVVQDNVIKPVSEDEQRDERGGRTEAGERGITSEIGKQNHDYRRDSGRKQNMPKDDHQHREERMDVQKVEKQKRGDDKHAQRTDTSVTERYSEGVQAQDSDSVRRDDPSLHPEQKIQKDVELDKKGKTEVHDRGMGSGPTKLMKKSDLLYSSEIQYDRRADDNKQKVPKDDRRCKEGGRSRHEGHEQERGVRRDVKGVTEQKRGDSEQRHIGQDVEDQSIVGLDDRQTVSEQKISGTCTNRKDGSVETQSKHIKNRSDSSIRRVGSARSSKLTECQGAACGEQVRRSNSQERPGSKSNEIKIIDEFSSSRPVARSSLSSFLRRARSARSRKPTDCGEQVRRLNSQERPGSKSNEIKIIDEFSSSRPVARSSLSSFLRRARSARSRKPTDCGKQVRRLNSQERPGSKSNEIKIIDEFSSSRPVARSSLSSFLRRARSAGSRKPTDCGEQVRQGNLSNKFAKLKVSESSRAKLKKRANQEAVGNAQEEESRASKKQIHSDTEDQAEKKGSLFSKHKEKGGKKKTTTGCFVYCGRRENADSD